MPNFFLNIKDTLFNFFKKPIYKKHYLKELVENLEKFQQEKKVLPFYIQKVTKTGFVVKIGGLYSFLSISHMPWHYNDKTSWKSVAKYLVNKKFYGTIYSLKKNPLKIIVDAKTHIFKDAELYPHAEYNGVVLKKVDYGLFIDIGYDFNWHHGSLVGLVYKPKKTISNAFNKIKEGTIISTIFVEKREEDGKILLQIKSITDDLENHKKQREIEWIKTKELEGTIQAIRVVIDKNEKNYFFEDYENKEIYKVKILVSKKNYPKKTNKIVQKILTHQTHNDFLECKILYITKNKIIFAKLEIKAAPQK